MGYFTATQSTLARRASVFYGELFKLEFLSGTKFYWDGFGALEAYGETFLGVPGIVQRSEIPVGIDDEAGKMTLTMPGVSDAVLALVRAEEPEIRGRGITVWGQFFDEALQIADDRWFLFNGTMDVPTYAIAPGQNTITIPCEGEWTDRETSPLSFFSVKDQKRRYADDEGMEFMTTLNNLKVQWP